MNYSINASPGEWRPANKIKTVIVSERPGGELFPPIGKAETEEDAILFGESKNMLQFIMEIQDALEDKSELSMWEKFVKMRAETFINKMCIPNETMDGK